MKRFLIGIILFIASCSVQQDKPADPFCIMDCTVIESGDSLSLVVLEDQIELLTFADTVSVIEHISNNPKWSTAPKLYFIGNQQLRTYTVTREGDLVYTNIFPCIVTKIYRHVI